MVPYSCQDLIVKEMKIHYWSVHFLETKLNFLVLVIPQISVYIVQVQFIHPTPKLLFCIISFPPPSPPPPTITVSSAQCSEFQEDNEFYGSYVWPADTNAERIVTHPCVYQCGNITGTNASRTCLGNGSWSPTNFTSCPTKRTCQLVNLTEVDSSYKSIACVNVIAVQNAILYIP